MSETTMSAPESLSRFKQGQRVVICGCTGQGAELRMRDLGLFPGEELLVVSSSFGPVLVRVGDARVGIGRGLARKVMCRRV